MPKTRTLGRQKQMNGILLSFLLGAAGALAIFLPFLVVDKGFFLYCGDFNSQQIPFYTYVQQFIKDGGGTWSWATDLGSSVITSYSFYNIGSPFLWLTMPFPSSWMPYLMVPLFMLKFGAIAAGCCLYLQRYAKTRNMAVICSVIYAFCSFNVYNTFFNHMLDPVALFPLLLWALDGFVYDNRRGWFALFVGLALLNSYFFFLGNVLFIFLYFLVKVLTREYVIDLRRFFQLALEAVLGVGIGMALALPSFYSLLQNPRTDDFANGFSLLIYGKAQQYFAILSSLLLPPDPPYDPNIYTDATIKWTSMAALLPVVSLSGVAAYWRARKKSGAKLLLAISLVMALVPILNSSFYAFNRSYYARWYYMPLLVMVFATLRALEDADIDLLYGAKFSLVATALFGILGLIPTKLDDAWTLGVAEEPAKFWLTWFTAMFGVVLFYVLVRFYRSSVRFAPLLLGAVLGFSVFYSVTHISIGKFQQWDRDSDFADEQYRASALLALPEDEGFYRIDSFNTHDNFGLWANKSCLQTFNSTVTPSIMEFYPTLGVKRDVSSKPETKFFGLRGLLSVRYTIVPQDEKQAFEADYTGSRGWKELRSAGPLVIYENENYLPLGFAYDSYVTMEDLRGMAEEDRSALLVRAIGLEQDQVLTYGHLFEDRLTYGYEAADYEHYVQDVEARRAAASAEVRADSSGFASRITLARETLVFYAVPYDEGFTATVNGEAAEVLKVSGGMMAVQAPAGENEIVFTYKTPGFAAGIFITLLSLAALGVYLTTFRLLQKRPRAGAQAAPPQPAKTAPPAGDAEE